MNVLYAILLMILYFVIFRVLYVVIFKYVPLYIAGIIFLIGGAAIFKKEPFYTLRTMVVVVLALYGIQYTLFESTNILYTLVVSIPLVILDKVFTSICRSYNLKLEKKIVRKKRKKLKKKLEMLRIIGKLVDIISITIITIAALTIGTLFILLVVSIVTDLNLKQSINIGIIISIILGIATMSLKDVE